MKYKGACHCGKTSYEVEGDLEQVIQCNCSICTKHGYLLWFVPRTQLTLQTPEENLATYHFNVGKINHHFCLTCGCAPFATGKSPNGDLMAAINVRCLEGIELSDLKMKPVDGRSF